MISWEEGGGSDEVPTRFSKRDVGDPQAIFGEPQKFTKGEVPKEQLNFVIVLNSL